MREEIKSETGSTKRLEDKVDTMKTEMSEVKGLLKELYFLQSRTSGFDGGF